MSSYRKENQELIIGLHSIEEILKNDPIRLVKVFTLKTSLNIKERKTTLLDQLRALGKPVEQLNSAQMDKLCDSSSHQGFAALIKKQDPFDLKAFFRKKSAPSLVLALDSIYDPHNLGAILRASECFGVDLVFWSKNRGSSLTPAVSKSSSSASIWVSTLLVSNLSTTIQQFVEEGYTLLVAHLGKQSESLFDFIFPEKTLLVLGSEGEGVRPILQKQAHHFLEIPMYGKVDSLNVSQAATLFCGFWKRQFSSK